MGMQDTDMVGLAASRVLFAHTSEGVLSWTQDGRITAANPAACAMLDLPAEEICRLGRDGLVDQEDPRWAIAVAESERTGSAVGVARLRRGDGRYIEIEMTAMHFRDEDGGLQTCSILHDQTGRLALERELEEVRARLLELSRGDELTGLQNRRGLLASGTQLLQFADRLERGGACALRRRRQRAGAERAPRPPDGRRRAAGGGPRLVGDLPEERRDGPHRRDPVPGADPSPRRTRLLDADRAHQVASRRTETRQFVGAPVEVCCGWTTRQAGERTSLEDLMARSEWAMLESRDGRRAGPFQAAGG